MLQPRRLGPRAWSGIFAGIFLAAFLGQSFLSPSPGAAQWETATPAGAMRYGLNVTPTGHPSLEAQITQSPLATSTPTPTPTLKFPVDALVTLGPSDTSTPTPNQQFPQEPLITLIPISTATSTRTPTPINLGNFVWDDLDADGLQDTGEPGVPGVTVQLWNNARTDLIATTTTNASGIYSLIAPIPGDYRIRVLLKSGDQYTTKDQGTDDTRDSDINTTGTYYGFTDTISIASNVISMTKIDAGLFVFKTPTPTRTPTPVNIGNFIWRDSDADGIQDAGETGVPNVTVQLWNSSKTQLIDSALTNANGNFYLIAPTSGDYRIRVLLPVAQAAFSPKLQGLDTTKDSNVNPDGADFGFTDIIFIAPNVISTTIYDGGLTKLPAVLPSPLYMPVIRK